MIAILKVHNYRLSNNSTSIALLTIFIMVNSAILYYIMACEKNLLSQQH